MARPKSSPNRFDFLVLNENLRRALGANGKRYALTEFSWESVLDRLVRQIDAAAA